ncbi:MAG: hypothetical protein M1829_000071 [Trizodia sp. TS-e1964]|nr:MAG: hypothetical protein M1829_000071 [Trizodia sp. TS-e1964]
MAPAKKARDAKFFEVGVQGRKTGITLKDSGVRDEHGLEPIDGIFSSPEKGPPQRNAAIPRGNNSTITSEIDMDVGQSTIPEPTELLTARRLNQPKRASLPPARSRSPIKTNLNSPARKLPVRPTPQNPMNGSLRAKPHYATNRRLFDLSNGDTIPSIEDETTRLSSSKSPSAQESPLTTRALKKSNRKAISQHLPLPSRSPEEQNSRKNNAGGVEGDEEVDLMLVSRLQSDEISGNMQNGDDSIISTTNGKIGDSILDESHLDSGNAEEPTIIQKRSNSTRSGLSTKPKIKPGAKPALKPVKSKPLPKGKKPTDAKGGKKPPFKSALTAEETLIGPDADEIEAEEPEEEEAGGEEEEEEPEETAEDEPPAKSNRPVKRPLESPHERVEHPNVRRAKNTQPKPHPSQRSSKARISSANKATVEAPETADEPAVDETAAPRPKKGRGLYILRKPNDDDGAQRTRSGRISVKPVAYWRNEQIVYGEDDENVEDANFLLPTIKEIIRTTEMEANNLSKKPRPRSKPSKKKHAAPSDSDDNDIAEAWESNPGVVMGNIWGWNELESQNLETESMNEIAYSARAIETREVANCTFRYAKTLTTPFFASGMVDLPPGGEKRPKNSRKMQLVFFVFSGKVLVEVAGSSFRISKGGMWQVPRGQLLFLR